MNGILGRFIPIDSVVNRFDPRIKLTIDFFFLILILFTDSFFSYLVLFIYIFIGMFLSKIPLKVFYLGLRSIMALIILMVFIQILFTPPQNSSDTAFRFLFITVSKDGLINSLIVFLRFSLMILMTTLLTASTSSSQIADGISYLLKPISFLGFDVKKFSMMISMALRFVPIFSDEFISISDAQRSRGLSYKSGSLLKRIKALIPMFIPLIALAFKKALVLADAMQVRGFIDADNRTSLHELKITYLDYFLILSFVLISILVFLSNFYAEL
ncbi:energy-coupling factor transporter transmembrane component T family protein [Oenococcus alcoholitolerans]|uniref:energy-coupling factor transporter transmembrane component T family protein n=1 Tax=Oenococcus alcoholitolerans TaxID=931074 RepID=UPI003F70CE13